MFAFLKFLHIFSIFFLVIRTGYLLYNSLCLFVHLMIFCASLHMDVFILVSSPFPFPIMKLMKLWQYSCVNVIEVTNMNMKYLSTILFFIFFYESAMQCFKGNTIKRLQAHISMFVQYGKNPFFLRRGFKCHFSNNQIAKNHPGNYVKLP